MLYKLNAPNGGKNYCRDHLSMESDTEAKMFTDVAKSNLVGVQSIVSDTHS